MPLSPLEKQRIWDEEKERFKAKFSMKLRLELFSWLAVVATFAGMWGMLWKVTQDPSWLFKNAMPASSPSWKVEIQGDGNKGPR